MVLVLLRRWLWLMLSLALLAACSSSPKVTLSGRVLDTYTNKPIEGALVTIGKGSSIPTDANGRWSTQAWEAQDTAVLQATGYEPVTINLAERPELTKPRVLTMTLDSSLRPNVLTGIVQDAFTEAPLEGAIVRATDSLTATTDAEGRYVLEDVPESFELTVQAPEHAEATTEVARTTEQDVALRPTTLNGMVTDSYTNKPVAGVDVTLGESRAQTDDAGQFVLKDIPPDGALVFTREGYDEMQMPLDRTTTIDVVMRPNVLEGIVRDAVSGAVLSDTLVLASSTYSGTAIISVRTDNEGRYRLENLPPEVYLKALKPGYKRGEEHVISGQLPDDIKLEPITAKALYVKANVAASREAVTRYFDLIDQTELNAMVLDLKSDNLEDVGLIYYDSQVPLVRELGTSVNKLDLPWILAEARKRNIYMIARVHIFAHDNALLEKKPEWYVQNSQTGKPWFADFGIAWLDAYNEQVWDYNIELGVEASRLGFDEVQFDYIRFPSDGDLSTATFAGARDWQNNPDEMYNTIGRFMERSQKAINNAGAYFGVDVFGYVSWEPQAMIGQSLSVMGKYADYVYPMVYPSHFVPNELGLGNPSLYPFELVDYSLRAATKQLAGQRAKLRPWLQDFTLIWVPEDQIVQYGPKEVRAQIDASEQNAVAGWALWDSDNDYTVGALKGPE